MWEEIWTLDRSQSQNMVKLSVVSCEITRAHRCPNLFFGAFNHWHQCTMYYLTSPVTVIFLQGFAWWMERLATLWIERPVWFSG